MLEDRLLGRLKVSFRDALRKRNWPMVALLAVAIGLVVIVFLVVGDSITDGAKTAGGSMVDAFGSFMSWPLSPVVVALALFIVAVVIIGFMFILEDRRNTSAQPRGQRAQTATENERLALRYRSWIANETGNRIAVITDGASEGKGIAWQGIREIGDPYITFNLPIVNASIFELDTEGASCEGKIVFNGHPLKGPPAPSIDNRGGSRGRLTRGRVGTLIIRQDLLPEVVREIREKANSEVVFSMGALTIKVSCHQPESSEPRELEFRLASPTWTGEWHVELPEANFLSA